MKPWTAALFTRAWAMKVSAGSDYKYTIERVVGASYEAYRQNYVGNQFCVHRQTDLMVGALKSFYVTRKKIIDHGSSENSFKVIMTMRKDQGIGAGSNIYALTINEYQNSARKPFIFYITTKLI
ncbi:hypothetical protein [Pseudomonas veronii]